MSDVDLKPLNWQPVPGIGYTVVRRPDGGMHFTFSDVTHATLEHWRAFSIEHLLNSDRLTRNLYDLRAVAELPDEAVAYAIEVNTDPSVRNIRLAVVVANETVRAKIQAIHDLTVPSGVEMGIFTDLEAAEAWLDRPLTLLV